MVTKLWSKIFFSIGEDGKYCWSTCISCNAGESLLQIYVVLPVHMSVFNGELQITSENILKPHRGQAPLPDECGLRFDVMGYFSGTKREPTFCVKVLPQYLTLGEGLRCHPFLVTVWQNQNHSPVSQGEGWLRIWNLLKTSRLICTIFVS